MPHQCCTDVHRVSRAGSTSCAPQGEAQGGGDPGQGLRRETMQQDDVAVIGGGIVGLATAYNLTQRFPERRVVVLEKEAQLAQHQTGHNSGVLHSGIYYKPGSLKAINCREGKKAMEAFCAAEGIEYEICGKVIVATSEAELP